MEIKNRANINIGPVSIATFLTALLLAVLALFSILAASINNLFLGKAIQHNSEYLHADAIAQQLLFEIDQSLVNGKPIPGECSQTEDTIEFSVEVRANIIIYVRVRILKNEEKRYCIEEYVLINTLEWQPKINDTPIWNGA